MKIPKIEGLIKRRILLNYRVEPEVVQRQLPANFRPKLQQGKSIAGICLIRLEQVRPFKLPSFLGIQSENAAHRIAVEWDTPEGVQEGVFVPRRDTDSFLNSLAGGRVFPGVHHHSAFHVSDQSGRIQMKVEQKAESSALVDIDVVEAERLPEDSIFSSLAEASEFFENGSIGYSSRPDSDKLDGLLLKVPNWKVSALRVDKVQSSYFDDEEIFPSESIEFDHALLMRDIDHEWLSQPMMSAACEQSS